MNPLRAGMVKHPSEYRWSSYLINGQGDELGLINPHPLYQRLGRIDTVQQAAYRDLFPCELESGEIDKNTKSN